MSGGVNTCLLVYLLELTVTPRYRTVVRGQSRRPGPLFLRQAGRAGDRAETTRPDVSQIARGEILGNDGGLPGGCLHGRLRIRQRSGLFGQANLDDSVQNHIEQFLWSAGCRERGPRPCDTEFHLSRLLDPELPCGGQKFRDWVDSAEGIAMDVVEKVASDKGRSRAGGKSKIPKVQV